MAAFVPRHRRHGGRRLVVHQYSSQRSGSSAGLGAVPYAFRFTPPRQPPSRRRWRHPGAATGASLGSHLKIREPDQGAGQTAPSRLATEQYVARLTFQWPSEITAVPVLPRPPPW